jgi:hypothetical protein
LVGKKLVGKKLVGKKLVGKKLVSVGSVQARPGVGHTGKEGGVLVGSGPGLHSGPTPKPWIGGVGHSGKESEEWCGAA